MAGHYHCFCRNFSEVVDLLTSKPKSSFPVVREVWFGANKALLCRAPVPVAPDFECPYKLKVDASVFGAGTVLLQEHEYGIDHPVF